MACHWENKEGGACVGKEAYFKYLMDTYQNLIFSICYKMTGNYFDAEDITQDTFLAAYKALDSFDGSYEKAWLARIAANKCINYCNSSQHRLCYAVEDETLDASPSGAASLDQHVLDEEVRQRLKENCLRLKSPYKEVALAYFYEEMEAAAIAKRYDRNIKTVQTQIYRARDALRKLYGKERRHEI